MTFLIVFLVLLGTYIVKFKEDFDKEKLEKFTTVGVIFIILMLVFYWITH
jgi:hypothetical protein